MDLLCVWRFSNILGTVVVLKLMSAQGQTGKEGIHEGVEVGVRDDSQNDEQVPKHGDQVCGQEESKEKGLQVWIIWEAQEEEFWETC